VLSIRFYNNPTEEIPLDHEAVEARYALLWVAPMQDKVVFDRGSEFVRH
jgi:hypothetical protein